MCSLTALLLKKANLHLFHLFAVFCTKINIDFHTVVKITIQYDA